MSSQAVENPYQDWVGREETCAEILAEPAVRAMAATLDLAVAPASGDALPPGWHWMYFNAVVRRSELGADGHPARGGFLPPVALPRRMWAGSRISYQRPLPVGAEATRRSEILSVASKQGKAGALCFVTVEHTISDAGGPCIVEQQDIVYKEATPPGTAPATPKVYEEVAEWTRDVTPDTTLLFRYSALTFNGHRIHYDLDYAQHEEGYPQLVVHGPLTATLLQQFALEHAAGRRLQQFDFRAVAPLFVDRAFTLEARRSGENALEVWARGPEGQLAMQASAVFGE
ncbi:FAS1-like dehydratase domain-containing protein [Haliea sp. E17]|uniref:FAS1-like dehydratase domain-containing protein n=1 Tax=Haliea sp. E17 TaxID=3401576 RepID=UPI003AB0E06B